MIPDGILCATPTYRILSPSVLLISFIQLLIPVGGYPKGYKDHPDGSTISPSRATVYFIDPPPGGGWSRLIPQGGLLLTGCLALSVLPLSLATIHAISLDLFIHIT